MNVIKDERNLFLLLNYTNQVPRPRPRPSESRDQNLVWTQLRVTTNYTLV